MKTTESGVRPGRPMTRNREHVLATAMEAYWHDDRAAVSVNAICALAGVSKPSLYRDFGSEDGLTAAVLDHYAQTVLGSVQALLSSPADYPTKLDALIAFASEDPSMEAGCLFVKMRATRSRFGPQTQAKLAGIESIALERYKQFLAQAAARGERRTEVQAELAAAYLHEQFGLAFALRAAGQSPALIRDLLSLALSVLR